MRRWSLALLVTLASSALAQAPEPAQAPSPAPSESKPPAPPPPAPVRQAAAVAAASGATDPEAEKERRELVKSEARFLIENLLSGDAKRAAAEFSYPFQLEDKKYATAEELVAAWVKQLRVKRTDLMTLFDVEVLSLAEMEKKYGKAPARLGLGSLSAKDTDIFAAVSNLSGHAAVLLFRAPKGAPAKAFAYTD
jgi:hypothetical protein